GRGGGGAAPRDRHRAGVSRSPLLARKGAGSAGGESPRHALRRRAVRGRSFGIAGRRDRRVSGGGTPQLRVSRGEDRAGAGAGARRGSAASARGTRGGAPDRSVPSAGARDRRSRSRGRALAGAVDESAGIGFSL